MFVLISYDISSDSRRKKVLDLLKDYGGDWVQYSVFECKVSKKLLNQLIDELKEHVDKDKDSLRVYRLCEDCNRKTTIIGLTPDDRAHGNFIV